MPAAASAAMAAAVGGRSAAACALPASAAAGAAAHRSPWAPPTAAPMRGGTATRSNGRLGWCGLSAGLSAGRGHGSWLAPRVASAADAATEEDAQDADYYALLGVASTASTDEIKRAYRRLAKEFHPDVSNDESSTDFAIFLNDVYETLCDPEKRAAYDAIAGFQIGGINPFYDTSYEPEMIFVDEFTCIGCRNCAAVCPSTFMMEEEWGRARVRDQGVDGIEKLQEAIDTCPVSCIHWVTAPQLALLEETMSRMERVAAFLLLSQGGKGANLNVFLEAATAWEKRQAALRSKVQAQQGWGAFWASPAAGSTMQDSARAAAEAASAGASASSSLGRGVNAATVAASARRWRDYQRAKRSRHQRLLTATSSADTEA